VPGVVPGFVPGVSVPGVVPGFVGSGVVPGVWPGFSPGVVSVGASFWSSLRPLFPLNFAVLQAVERVKRAIKAKEQGNLGNFIIHLKKNSNSFRSKLRNVSSTL
jgi:hypothetical protein